MFQSRARDNLREVNRWREKLVEEKFETWTTLNRLLGDYGCSEVDELTQEQSMQHGTQLKELHKSHVKETVGKLKGVG